MLKNFAQNYHKYNIILNCQPNIDYTIIVSDQLAHVPKLYKSFRTQSSRGRLGGTGKIDEDFLDEYNHLRWLERDTTRNMASIADKTLSSSGKYIGQPKCRFYLNNLIYSISL